MIDYASLNKNLGAAPLRVLDNLPKYTVEPETNVRLRDLRRHQADLAGARESVRDEMVRAEEAVVAVVDQQDARSERRERIRAFGHGTGSGVPAVSGSYVGGAGR